jgi:hypothetical protein
MGTDRGTIHDTTMPYIVPVGCMMIRIGKHKSPMIIRPVHGTEGVTQKISKEKVERFLIQSRDENTSVWSSQLTLSPLQSKEIEDRSFIGFSSKRSFFSFFSFFFILIFPMLNQNL